jgi:hypothetical protein
MSSGPEGGGSQGGRPSQGRSGGMGPPRKEGQQGAELLRALGRVGPPAPRVLEAAREVLWSALAAEALSADAAGETLTGETRAGGTDRSRPDIRRHRTQRDEPGP